MEMNTVRYQRCSMTLEHLIDEYRQAIRLVEL